MRLRTHRTFGAPSAEPTVPRTASLISSSSRWEASLGWNCPTAASAAAAASLCPESPAFGPQQLSPAALVTASHGMAIALA